VICTPVKSDSCTHRYDVPGEYYFTSGIVVEQGVFKLAFGGLVVVLPKNDLTVDVQVLVDGNLFFHEILLFGKSLRSLSGHIYWLTDKRITQN